MGRHFNRHRTERNLHDTLSKVTKLAMVGHYQLTSLKAMIARWIFCLSVVICAALMPRSMFAADGVPENAADGDPCGGIRPCDLGGTFTINEMLQQKPFPIRGVCESRCFWQAVVNNSCFERDAIIDIHAPVDPDTGKLNRLAADILISETKSPGVRRYLKDSGAAYRVSFTRLTGQDLIDMGAPACH